MADETKSGLEDLVKGNVQNGAGSDGKDGGSQPGTDGNQSSKGTWITALPEDIRKGIEAEKYANLNEYVRDLQKAAAGSVHDDKAFTEGWDSYIEEMKSSGDMLPDSIQQVLKESHVDADTAKKLMKAVSDYGLETMKNSQNAARNEMKDFIGKEWGNSFDENNEALKYGLRLFGKNHPDLAMKANKRGSIFTPEFAQILVDYAKLDRAVNREHNAPEGTPSPKTDPDNPFGLKHI